MTEENTSLAIGSQDWETSQHLLLQAVTPCSDEPLRAQYRRARQVVSLCSGGG